jgi:hypothetical protein
MVAAVVFHIAFPLSTGWIVLHGVFGIEKWTCILVICGLTALYTVLGGLAAVVMTETIQAIVLIAGAMIITAFAYAKVGGWDHMVQVLESTNETFRLSVLRSPTVEKESPWFAVFLGYPVLGIWYWCADQTIVQRVLGARDENHARIGPLFCAVIKILPVFIFVLPGLLFYVILKNGMISGVSVENSKEVYGLMIKTLLPTGLFGVMAAALMAAKAIDDDEDTRWATDGKTGACWLEVDLGKPETFDRAVIQECIDFGVRVKAFELQYKDGDRWKTFHSGKAIGKSLEVKFAPVTARIVRLNITEGQGGPTIQEFQLFAPRAK